MNFPRRRFLGSSLVVLGSSLLDALTTPVWRLGRPLALKSTTEPQVSPVTFVDVALEAGVTAPNDWGAVDHKRHIREAKGSGFACCVHDSDDWLDIYLPNGTRLNTGSPAG